ncbi:MAG TPA: S1/P1 nuclease [Terriglobales bacterium]|nr:S1/P1 nuclease [Terriglobales bacterium]
MVLVLLLLPLRMFGWGCRGHETVALLAWQQMGPHARQRAAELLARSPIDPALARYCPNPGLGDFVDSSTWADDIREHRPETGPWHFINIPLGMASGDLNPFCPTERACVVQAIRRQLEVLRSPQAGTAEQAEALRFLIHLVGDLHQPLHATTNNDQGGNCVPVTFFGAMPQPVGSTPEELARDNYRPNLHGVWDTELVERSLGAEALPAFARRLRHRFARDSAAWKRQPADLEAWAWESHDAAVRVAYGKLPHAVTAEAPRPITRCSDDDQVGRRMLGLQESIGPAYFQQAKPVIDRQLARAGTRLAALLNQLWP